MKINKTNKLFLILVLALVLRLISINQSLWLDEAIGAINVKNRNFLSVALQFPKGDNHPPLYYMFLDVWSSIFGYSEFSLRSISVIAGVASVYLLYKIAYLIEKSGVFAFWTALILATSPFHIYYSQEARMYIFTGLFASLSIYHFIKVLKSSDDKVSWYIFSASLVLLLFTDYITVYLLPVFLLAALVYKKDVSWWKKLFASFIPLTLLGALWVPVFSFQLKQGKWLVETLPAWQSLSGGATIKNVALVWNKFVFGRISLINKTLYYLLVIVVSIPFVTSLFTLIKRRKGYGVIWFWFLTPLILGFVTSFIFPAFNYFRFVYVLSAFYLLIVMGAMEINKKFSRVILYSLLLVNIVGLSIYYLDPYQKRENWRGAVAFVEANVKEDEVVLFENKEPFAPYIWYEKKPGHSFGALDSIASNEVNTYQILDEILSEANGVYYFEYLQDLHDPNMYVQQFLKDNGFVIKKEFSQFWGVGSIYYYRKL